MLTGTVNAPCVLHITLIVLSIVYGVHVNIVHRVLLYLQPMKLMLRRRSGISGISVCATVMCLETGNPRVKLEFIC